jgi:hypothetical protein
VLQQRPHGDVNFNRKYEEYVNGFGTVAGDYWLGLEQIHQLMSSPDTTFSVRFSYLISNGTREYVLYGNVSVGDSRSGYTLHVTRTSQDVSSLPLHYTLESGAGLYYNDGMKFSTMDHDVDKKGDNCARTYGGGWWYKSCTYMYINSNQANQPAGYILSIDGGSGGNIANPGMGVRRN